MVIVDLFILMCVVVGLAGLATPALMIMNPFIRLILRHRSEEDWFDQPARDVPPEAPKATAGERLPDDVQVKVDEIHRLSKDDLSRMTDAHVALADEINRLNDEHLPELLHAYMRIPKAHRDDVLEAMNCTASERLHQGLDSMAGRLVEIEAILSRGNLDAFAETTRFVDARYRSGHGQI